MMASGRTSLIASGMISGSGFAMAKMIGFSAIEATIFLSTASFTDRPKKTSAPFIASARLRCLVATAWPDFHWFMPASRPW